MPPADSQQRGLSLPRLWLDTRPRTSRERLHTWKTASLATDLFMLLVAATIFDLVGSTASSLGWMLNLLSLAVGIWALIELGILRGTTGPNQHGPDPLAA